MSRAVPLMLYVCSGAGESMKYDDILPWDLILLYQIHYYIIIELSWQQSYHPPHYFWKCQIQRVRFLKSCYSRARLSAQRRTRYIRARPGLALSPRILTYKGQETMPANYRRAVCCVIGKCMKRFFFIVLAGNDPVCYYYERWETAPYRATRKYNCTCFSLCAAA